MMMAWSMRLWEVPEMEWGIGDFESGVVVT